MADPLLLSRIQFGANISFHILFPAISIALSWVLGYYRFRANGTGAQSWLDAYGFWVKVFALTFAVGVVSGVTMSFQFGTNWPGYMNRVGNVAGPLLAYEVLTAFFLEAAFLGVMLFGGDRVSPRIHLLATLLVAVGTTLSAFWILALNSWMQTPAGYTNQGGIIDVASWHNVIFNPSLPYRFTHMLFASGLTVGALIAGISAYRWRLGQRRGDVLIGLRTGVAMLAVLAPLQLVAGDLHGLNTLAHQPAKIAAIEGSWVAERGAPMVIAGVPNEGARRNDYALTVPHLASLYLTHSWDGEVPGLADYPDHPPVWPVFVAFRIMVGIGLLFWFVSWLAAAQMRRHRAPSPGLLRAFVALTFAGWVAVLSGWYVTEIGRQPWLVTGILRTADAVTATAPACVMTTLLMYLLLYAALLVAYCTVLFHLARSTDHSPPRAFSQRHPDDHSASVSGPQER